MFAFYGDRMMTKRDMLQLLRSSLAKNGRRQLRQTLHNCHERGSERLNSSLTTWSLFLRLWKVMIIFGFTARSINDNNNKQLGTTSELQRKVPCMPHPPQVCNKVARCNSSKCVTFSLMSMREMPTSQHMGTTKNRSAKISQFFSCSHSQKDAT